MILLIDWELFYPLEVTHGQIKWWLPPAAHGRYPAGEGIIVLEGFQPFRVHWTDIVLGIGRCSPPSPRLEAVKRTVSGRVHVPMQRGEPCYVLGCGGVDVLEPACGGEYHLAITESVPCSVEATWGPGQSGKAVTVVPEPTTGSVRIDLSITPFALRILGIDVAVLEGGLTVIDGGHGFEMGDVVEAIDGVPLENEPDPLSALVHAVSDVERHEVVLRRGDERLTAVFNGTPR